jgi:hypothetical protein
MDTNMPSDEAQIETGLQHLKNIEEELEEIKERTGGPKRSLFNGIWQGVGAIIGGVIAIVAIGGLLSLIGIIPGFGDIAAYLHGVVDNAKSTTS